MFGQNYTTNDSSLWALLWLLDLRIADLQNLKHRQSLLEFAGKFAVPCVAEALMNVLKVAQGGDQ